jgi:xylulokinase
VSLPTLVGIDLGTSGVKVMIADTRILGEGEASYRIATRRPGWAETEPEEWWRATRLALHQAAEQAHVDLGSVTGVGVVGQMHGLVLCTQDARPVRPALLWPDQRAETIAAAWSNRLTPQDRARLANPLVPGMTGPMLGWIAEHEPESLRQARWALLPKDWVRLKLTGEAASDPSDASATLLWDLPAEDWSEAALAAAQAPRRLLPPVRGSGAHTGSVTAAAAKETGLPQGVAVATGAGDTAAALLASGLADGEVQVAVGSGAQITTRTDAPDPVGGTHVYRTAESSGWYRMAAVASAGLALDWVRGLLQASWQEFSSACTSGEPGSGGVTFTPFLVRERLVDTGTGGGFSGLRLRSDRAAVLRAAAEGVAFSVRRSAELLPHGLGDTVRLAGGVGRDPAFRRLLADVLGVGLRPVRQRSASALGAVVLAARAAGLDDPEVPPTVEEPVHPGPDAEAYTELYHRWPRGRH